MQGLQAQQSHPTASAASSPSISRRGTGDPTSSMMPPSNASASDRRRHTPTPGTCETPAVANTEHAVPRAPGSAPTASAPPPPAVAPAAPSPPAAAPAAARAQSPTDKKLLPMAKQDDASVFQGSSSSSSSSSSNSSNGSSTGNDPGDGEQHLDANTVPQQPSSSPVRGTNCNVTADDAADGGQGPDLHTRSSPVRGTNWLVRLWPLSWLAFLRPRHSRRDSACSPDQASPNHAGSSNAPLSSPATPPSQVAVNHAASSNPPMSSPVTPSTRVSPHHVSSSDPLVTSPATPSAHASVNHVSSPACPDHVASSNPPVLSPTTPHAQASIDHVSSTASCLAPPALPPTRATLGHATPVAARDTSNSRREGHRTVTAATHDGHGQQDFAWQLANDIAHNTNEFDAHLQPVVAARNRSNDGLEHWEAIHRALLAKARNLQHQWELELVELFRLQAQYMWWTRYQGRSHLAGLAIKVNTCGKSKDLSLAVKLTLGGAPILGTGGQEGGGLVLFETGRSGSLDQHGPSCATCGGGCDTGNEMCCKAGQASPCLGTSLLEEEGQKCMDSSHSGRDSRSGSSGAGSTEMKQDRCVSPAKHRQGGSSWQLLINVYSPQVEASRDLE
ncbi:hypothetical protein DUNSADRAFT_740 [Dunaliella salina]|uniref:Uncharacterized protein n=1 Tax=Dunaliella salina TaxID=3046 RepID=A0ABQ7GXX4_DUNSA|nr:hypothetical protein DUNSADRAFT_740 [Dunaliella salina]|eukprot:KAF5839455.1 hypothetical protein DUNSADRAFT_740 [Dunaliella salina]